MDLGESGTSCRRQGYYVVTPDFPGEHTRHGGAALSGHEVRQTSPRFINAYVVVQGRRVETIV